MSLFNLHTRTSKVLYFDKSSINRPAVHAVKKVFQWPDDEGQNEMTEARSCDGSHLHFRPHAVSSGFNQFQHWHWPGAEVLSLRCGGPVCRPRAPAVIRHSRNRRDSQINWQLRNPSAVQHSQAVVACLSS
jgi:hypothetical protein